MSPNTINSLSQEERPREKMLAIGAHNLTNEELLAILFRSGGLKVSSIDLARNLLQKYGGFREFLNVELAELTQIKDVGLAKATSLKAACEISLRILDKSKEVQKIANPEDAYKWMYKDLYGKKQEHLYVLNLDSKNRPLSKDLLTTGTADQTLITSKEVYKKALSKNAAYIILVHNHPSNDPTPSKYDIATTETIAEAGKKIGIPLLDHIIFTDSNYVSLKSLNVFSTYKFK